jgi:transcription-repair coupling factor (superfamily II helicase)
MESPEPMDRLLCGDVGYGKTEVVMRATFKALGDGKQVVLLAPTTVLAFQHFETFNRRFQPFPVRVEMFSRFRSAKVLRDISGIETPPKDWLSRVDSIWQRAAMIQ